MSEKSSETTIVGIYVDQVNTKTIILTIIVLYIPLLQLHLLGFLVMPKKCEPGNDVKLL